jgi:hypothetical protein
MLVRFFVVALSLACLNASPAQAADREGWHDMTQSSALEATKDIMLEKLVGDALDVDAIRSHPNGYNLFVTEIDLNGDGTYEYVWKLMSEAYCDKAYCLLHGVSDADFRMLTPGPIKEALIAYRDDGSGGWRDLLSWGSKVHRWNGTGYEVAGEFAFKTPVTREDHLTETFELQGPWWTGEFTAPGVSVANATGITSTRNAFVFYCREDRPRVLMMGQVAPREKQLAYLTTGLRSFYSRYEKTETGDLEIDLSADAGRAILDLQYPIFIQLGRSTWTLPAAGARNALSSAIEGCSSPASAPIVADVTTLVINAPRSLIETIDRSIALGGQGLTRDQAAAAILAQWAAAQQASSSPADAADAR